MGVMMLLFACFYLHVGDFVSSDPLGKDFALIFMQNFHPDHGKPKLLVTLTAFSPGTNVKVFLPNGMFEKMSSVFPHSPMKVVLPMDIELQNGTRSNKVLRIHSSGLLSVVASNERPYTGSIWIVYPTSEWGKEYYVFTPDTGPKGTFGQIAVVNGPKSNVVKVTVTGVTYFNKKNFQAGERLQLTLKPWESLQLQSPHGLSGSHLLSTEAIGVFAGHSCAQKSTHCTHICMQLLPVTSWGSHFVLPPIQFQNTTNHLYIMASAETTVLVKNGDNTSDRKTFPGTVEEYPIHSSTSAYISSTVGLMVLLYGSGGIYKYLVYDGFLINMTPEEDFCSSYALVSMPSFRNFAFLAVPKNGILQLQLNKTRLTDLKWGDVANTQLAHTQLTLNLHGGYTDLSDPGERFGVFVAGIANMNAYGIQAVCLDKVKSLHADQFMDEPVSNGNVNSTPPNAQSLSIHPTCVAWGRSHYRAFDGSHIIQSGNCTAMLLAFMDNETNSESFTVERKIIPDIALRIKVYGSTIEIPASEETVTVDGMLHYPQITLNEGRVNLTQHGFVTEASFSFGLHVLVGSSDLHLEVPSIFGGMSGLCMGLQMDPSTEGRNNQTSPEPLGDDELACSPGSWQHYEECGKTLSNMQSCEFLEELEVFKQCHALMDPQPFVESCRFDICAMDSSNPCVSLEAYARACGREGINLNEWRNLTGCDPRCPPNSYYDSCSRFQSCPDPQDAMCDHMPCYENCVCQQDFQLYMGLCIPTYHGGCMWEGIFYSNGSEQRSSDCQTLCQCNGLTGKVECRHVHGCDPGYQCASYKGVWSCHALTLQCSVYKGTNYITLNGQANKNMPYCITRMVEVCAPVYGMPVFNLTLVSEAGETPGSSYIKAVDIHIAGRLVTLSHEYAGRIEVDGVLLNTPVLLNNGDLEIFRGGLEGMILQARHGPTILFDGDGRVFANLPINYSGAICGLCANRSNDSLHDLEICSNECQENCSSCTSKGSDSSDNCGMLIQDKGPFRDCYKRINHETFVSWCIQDVCSQDDLCQVLSAFTAQCQEAGFVVHPWRTDTFCSPVCPPNSSYKLCASSCPQTCSGLQPSSCPLPCREGCSCDPGYILSGEQCVLPENCGCSDKGVYWKKGEAFYTDHCQELCECQQGKISCKNISCLPEEECILSEGVRSCSTKMLPACWVTSGLYYHTFDGAVVDVNGNCSYTMAKLCQPSNLTIFEVHLQAKDLDTNSMLLNKVDLYIYGHNVSFSRDGDGIQVDGETKSLPTTIKDGRIMASEAESVLHIFTDFGFLFLFGPSWVSLWLPASYAGSVCGLCGNANGNVNDDLEHVNGTGKLSLWSPHPNNTCTYSPRNINETNTTDSSQYKDKCHCGLIQAKEGIFRACHAVVPPDHYFNMCVLNMVLENGNEEALRQSIRSYTDACRSAGAIIHPWWKDSEDLTGPVESPADTNCLQNCTGPVENPTDTSYLQNCTEPVENPATSCLLNQSLPGCVPKGQMSCFISQNFNTIPFGGMTFKKFSGSPNVTFAHLCHGDGNLIPFAIYYVDGPLESRGQLWVNVYDLHIVLEHQERINVWVNGMFLVPPATILPGQVWINQNGGLLTLETDYGLSVVHDGEFLLIYLPDDYAGHVCGLCSQMNMSEGSTPAVSIDSWKCNATSDPSPCLLLVEDGPFSVCHKLLSPHGFYQLCIAQQHQFSGESSSVCRILQVYATSCQSQGIPVLPWRKDNFCPTTQTRNVGKIRLHDLLSRESMILVGCFSPIGAFQCPVGSQYIRCKKLCPPNCIGKGCSSRCVESCSCPEGQVWDGTDCVDEAFSHHGGFQVEMEVLESLEQSEFLTCWQNEIQPPHCLKCTANNVAISTFHHFNASMGYTGAYELLKMCNYLSRTWLRVVFDVHPSSPGKLYIFFGEIFITMSNKLNVWVNGKNMWLPVAGPSNSFIKRLEGLVAFVLPGIFEITLSSSSEARVAVFDGFPHKLCGACVNLSPTHSLESWRAVDLS